MYNKVDLWTAPQKSFLYNRVGIWTVILHWSGNAGLWGLSLVLRLLKSSPEDFLVNFFGLQTTIEVTSIHDNSSKVHIYTVLKSTSEISIYSKDSWQILVWNQDGDVIGIDNHLPMDILKGVERYGWPLLWNIVEHWGFLYRCGYLWYIRRYMRSFSTLETWSCTVWASSSQLYIWTNFGDILDLSLT